MAIAWDRCAGIGRGKKSLGSPQGEAGQNRADIWHPHPRTDRVARLVDDGARPGRDDGVS